MRISAPRERSPTLLLVAISAIGALLVLVPLAVTIIRAAQVPPARAGVLLFRPLVGELLLNTLSLVVAATAVTALVGMACAWFIERTHLPGRRVWSVLAAVPLAVPPFVSSYAWVSLSPALQDFAGALLIVSCSYYPLVYLPVAAALRGLDPALEETARSLGESAWGSFFRVVLPQLRPALLGSMLLVALHLLTEFGAFALLRFRTFTTEIFVEYRTGFNGPNAALLAMVLLALSCLCLIAEFWVRGGARYSRTGRGTRRRAGLQELRWASPLVVAGFSALNVATLVVPAGTILYWLTQRASAATTPAGVSLGRLIAATFSSAWVGLGGAAFTVLLALPLAFFASRHRGRIVRILEGTVYIAQGIPAIVVAMALIAATIHFLRPAYQSVVLLLVAYAILFLPLAVVAIRAALIQAQPVLEDTARSLGLTATEVMWRVVLPMARPGLGAAAALVFVSIATELTATLLLAPIGMETLATQVWANSHDLAFAAAAPYAAAMMALSFLSTWLLARRFGRNVFVAV